MARTVEGRDKLIAKLKALPAAAQRAMTGANETSAEALVGMARRLAPEGSTGALNRSIRREQAEQGLKVLVIAGGTNETRREVRQGSGIFTDEAILVEFGTKAHRAGGKFKGALIPAIPARPFFFPAWRALKRSMKSRYARAVNKAAKEIAAR